VDILPFIAEERRRIADLVDTFSPGQLATPSLCTKWTVKDVAAHLLTAVATPGSWYLPAIVRGRFRIHEANVLLARRMADRPASELAAGLRANADNPFRPPVVGHLGQLTDLYVHGQDMRRPLGLPHDLRPERLRLSLDFLTGGRAPGFVPKQRPAGLRFETTDLDWSWGAGPVVRGPAEAVMLGLVGRTVVLPELDGDGVAVLRARLTA
jgi:uncharacterized protein (TIGR03083 family)